MYICPQINTLTQQLDKARSQVQEAHAERQGLQDSLALLKQDLARSPVSNAPPASPSRETALIKAAAQLKLSLEFSEKQVGTLKEENHDFQEEIEDLKAEIDALKGEISALRVRRP